MATPLGHGMSLVADHIVPEENPSLNGTFKLDDTGPVNKLNESYTVAVDSKLNTTMDSGGLTESAANTTEVTESESNETVTLQENEDVKYSGSLLHVSQPSCAESDSSSYCSNSSIQAANFCKSRLDKVNLDTCQSFSPCHLLSAAFQNLKIGDFQGETSFIGENQQEDGEQDNPFSGEVVFPEEQFVAQANGIANDLVNVSSSVDLPLEDFRSIQSDEMEFGKNKFIQENTVTVVLPEKKEDIVSRPSVDGVQGNPVRIGSPVDDKNAESTKTISVVEESNLAAKECILSDCSLTEVTKEDIPFAVSSMNITVINRSETAKATTEMLSTVTGDDVSTNLPQLEKNEEEVSGQHIEDLQLIKNQEATLVKFGTAESLFVEHMNCLDQEIDTAILNPSSSEYDQKSADFEKYSGLKLEIDGMKQDVARLMSKITRKEREILMLSPQKMRFPSSTNVEESRKCADNDLKIKTLLSENEDLKKSLNDNENKLSTVERELEVTKEANVKYTQYLFEAEALITAFSKKAEEAERDKKKVTDAFYNMIEKYEHAKKIILGMKRNELVYKAALEKFQADKTDNKENQRNN